MQTSLSTQFNAIYCEFCANLLPHGRTRRQHDDVLAPDGRPMWDSHEALVGLRPDRYALGHAARDSTLCIWSVTSASAQSVPLPPKIIWMTPSRR